MRVHLFLIAAIITATIRGASAQTGTADGVAAMARGDYQRAVEILRPIAEDSSRNDPVAQVFMGGLYETGRGVPADPLRACALYQRATAQHDHPFGRVASALFAASTSRSGLKFDHECQYLANIGFDTGFEPVTFHLGPGHFVEWTLGAATVTYEGRTRQEPVAFAQRSARFLPLQHTELDTGPTRSVRRHFIQLFIWQQMGMSGPWHLQWHIFEVIRDEIIRIDTPESLATVAGDAPPSREMLDVREYAALRVDDEGNAEWAVLKGPHSSTRRIESDAERREVRDTERARGEALKRVDWSRRDDVNRQPSMTYADGDGCGHIEMYGWTASRDEAVVVRVNGSELDFALNPATFDIARESANISLEAYVYDAPQRQFNFCSDVRVHEAGSTGPEIWRAVAGTISIELSPPGIRAHNPGLRRATAILSNVVLRNSAGRIVRVSQPVRLTAIVGSGFY